MFTSSKKSKPQTGASSVEAPSIISQGLTIIGNMVSTGDMQIDGAVTGDIVGHKVTVGESARVDGDIQADEVMIRGMVNGRIRAKTVAFAHTARVTGDVIHAAMSMEAGARLDGHVRQVDNPAERPPTIPGLLKDGDMGSLGLIANPA